MSSSSLNKDSTNDSTTNINYPSGNSTTKPSIVSTSTIAELIKIRDKQCTQSAQLQARLNLELPNENHSDTLLYAPIDTGSIAQHRKEVEDNARVIEIQKVKLRAGLAKKEGKGGD